MRRKGIPTKFVRLLREYYSDKTPQVSVEGLLPDNFPLATGLGQGCCWAPCLKLGNVEGLSGCIGAPVSMEPYTAGKP